MTRSITRDELNEQLGWFTDAVSKGVRAIAFGTIAAGVGRFVSGRTCDFCNGPLRGRRAGL